jgi:hypothetical protein
MYHSYSRKIYHHSTEDDSHSIVFKSSKSRDREGLSDSSVSVSSSRPHEDNNNQETSISDCSNNMCIVSLQKRTVPPTHSYTNVGCADDVSAVALSRKESLYKGKIPSTKTSHEFTSSSDDSNVSVDKVMVKYQEAKNIASFWKIENPFIHVSL